MLDDFWFSDAAKKFRKSFETKSDFRICAQSTRGVQISNRDTNTKGKHVEGEIGANTAIQVISRGLADKCTLSSALVYPILVCVKNG